jgi:hypothetical protein
MPGQKLNLPLLTPVCGKKRHHTQSEGQAHLEMLRRCEQARETNGGESLRIYWRRTCGVGNYGTESCNGLMVCARTMPELFPRRSRDCPSPDARPRLSCL